MARESQRLQLRCARSEIARARTFVSATLEAWNQESIAADAVLLVSELATNAVLHAGTDLVVSVIPLPTGVRVEVADGNPAAPHPRQYGPMAGTGRGLMLVDRYASAWGVERRPDGKSVWVEITDAGEMRQDESDDRAASLGPVDLAAFEALGGWDEHAGRAAGGSHLAA